MSNAATREKIYHLRATRIEDDSVIRIDYDLVPSLVSQDEAREHVCAIKVLTRLNDGTSRVDFDNVLAALGSYEDTGEIYLIHSQTGVRWFWNGEDWSEALDILDGPLLFDEEGW